MSGFQSKLSGFIHARLLPGLPKQNDTKTFAHQPAQALGQGARLKQPGRGGRGDPAPWKTAVMSALPAGRVNEKLAANIQVSVPKWGAF